MKSITVDELRAFRDKAHEKSYMLIDVRQKVEYEEGHIPGAVLLPLDEFEKQVDVLPEKDKIFYCRTGSRSNAAALTADFFNESGNEIYNLEGGILSWNGIQIEGVPLVRTFDLTESMDKILTDAMNLEKGAYRFYSHILSKYPDLGLDDVMANVRDGEIGHAKLIYSHLKKIKSESFEFHALYDGLKGDILEGGESLEAMIASLEKRSGDIKFDILETAVTMEYRAFDLYRVISESAKGDALKEAFYSLSQAEKAHMNILLNALETLVGAK